MRALRFDEIHGKRLNGIDEVYFLRKRINELEKQNKALKKSLCRKSEESDQKDKLLSVLAHDLKNPLGTIIGFSDLLNKNSVKYDTARLQKYSSLINQTARQSYSLLLNLLDWFRSNVSRPDVIRETIDLKKIVSQNILLYQTLANSKGIEIEDNVPENLPVFADLNLTTAVIRNLISNAVKFTQENGKILINAIEFEDYVEIIISDNGPGINEEDLKKLFSQGCVASSIGSLKEKGTGLGLILCKEFVEKIGGKIWVKSEINKGSSFHFTVPVLL